MKETIIASIARRLADAAAAAARGVAQAIEGTMPAPQPIPVRVSRARRG